MNLNPHFHAVVIDGAYTQAGPLDEPEFHRVSAFTDEEVDQLRGELEALLPTYRRFRPRLAS